MKNGIKRNLFLPAVFSVIGLIIFFITHVNALFNSTVLFYTEIYVVKAWEFVLPVMIAYVIVAFVAQRGISSALLPAVLASLSKLCCYLPYYYEYFVLESGYTTGDALIISFIRSISECALTLIHASALALIAFLLFSLLQKRTATEPLVLQSHDEVSPFDFSCPHVQISLLISLLQLLYSLAFEIIDTVEFLSSYGNTAEINEICTIVINYAVLIILSLASHFVLIPKLLKKHL